MRDLDENSITAAVLKRLAATKTPRMRHISEALVRHLHAFVREIEPTEAEWEQAIAFLTETGQTCTDRRQEFILLSDTLGVSMLVDSINHRQVGEATETTVFGPFFVAAAPEASSGTNIAGHLPGPALFVVGRVLDGAGSPLTGATVDAWHADAEGYYDIQYENGELAGRGRFHTDAGGNFNFWSVMPSAYPIPYDGPVGRMLAVQDRHPYRPAHVHFMITAAGHTRLVTHLFSDASDYLDSDVVFGVKESLIRRFELRSAGEIVGTHLLDKPCYVLQADFRLAFAPIVQATLAGQIRTR